MLLFDEWIFSGDAFFLSSLRDSSLAFKILGQSPWLGILAYRSLFF